ncbi:sensor histidine kinase [Sphingobacterium sp. E70]|uniref:ATP-binding protein n=1 Tax=Sphingobacterium sp. E70 TaxID=2853439 RepID=UPI00359CA092
MVDNGIGISTDNQFKIFEEYYREEQANDSIGTGIGLALTKQIVLQHQGEIRCFTMKDEKGEWTVFNLRLPKLSKVHISSPSDSLMTVIDESNLATPSVMDRSLQQTILIVEDNRELWIPLSICFRTAILSLQLSMEKTPYRKRKSISQI